MSRPLATEDVFQAISHPTRRRIIDLLRRGDLPAGAIASEFHHSAPTISMHLRVLQATGLVTQRREGRSRVYSLQRKPLAAAAAWVSSMSSDRKAPR
jgi:DNA-binding transcriptional ArsR family regulator